MTLRLRYFIICMKDRALKHFKAVVHFMCPLRLQSYPRWRDVHCTAFSFCWSCIFLCSLCEKHRGILGGMSRNRPSEEQPVQLYALLLFAHQNIRFSLPSMPKGGWKDENMWFWGQPVYSSDSYFICPFQRRHGNVKISPVFTVLFISSSACLSHIRCSRFGDDPEQLLAKRKTKVKRHFGSFKMAYRRLPTQGHSLVWNDSPLSCVTQTQLWPFPSIDFSRTSLLCRL